MTETETPNRATARTAQGLVIVSSLWSLAALATALSAARLMEMLDFTAYVWLLGAVFLGAPSILIALGLWRVFRRERLAIAALMQTAIVAIGLHVASAPLWDTSANLNFHLRRATYDALVADAEARRLAVTRDSDGWLAGERGGVSFRVDPSDPSIVRFPWTGPNTHLYEGVIRLPRDHGLAGGPTPYGKALGGGYFRESLVF